ncbi:hypothetical protein F5Y17DRAFT_183655 [Xylariaceae sp. FL0594]|nr:hypothetical protein F5Y17DRAFT_183655 [Xylariaceae sp. FL0594]
MPGETEPIINKVPLSIEMVMAGCFGIAVYNSLEVYISVFQTFRRRNGLYFWSAMLANTGIPLVSISTLLRFFDVAPIGPMTAIYILGWWLMVTGQSFVLYSRMHLVIHDPRQLRWLLCMIIASFLVLQLSTSVLFLYINFERHPSHGAIVAFDVIEKVQIVGFTLQESFLSGLYVYEASSTLKPIAITKGERVRKLFREIIALCVVVIALDISLVITQYTDHFHVQTAYKPVVYSIKLKVEAFVLNNLIALVQPTGHSGQLGLGIGLRHETHKIHAPWWLQHDTPMGAISGSDMAREWDMAILGNEQISLTNTAERNRLRAPKTTLSLPLPK